MGRTIIIGAGASGLMAANVLAQRKEEVFLLEKKHQAGLKLRITGKGRCNLTNACEYEEYLSKISNAEFFSHAFKTFDNKALMQFFENRNCPLTVERGGRVFPKSSKAIDVFLCLMQGIENKTNVHLVKNCNVKDIILKGNKVVGVITDKGSYQADNVIMACGGATYPSTGSTGDGYTILNNHKIKITKPIPTLTGLRTMDGYDESLQGFLIKNCNVTVTDTSHKVISEHFGDVMLDTYGVAGPVILTISRQIAKRLDNNEKLSLCIDIKPKVDKDKLYEQILSTFSQRRTQSAFEIVRKWMLDALCHDALRRCKINPKTMGYKLSERDAKQLLWYMKARKQPIIGDFGWNESIITMGGVALSEVNKDTLELKKIKNLYVCGELLDLDAPTGGYNLQIAFSTGFLAATSILASR